MRFKFVLASGIHARRCGGVRQLIGRCEGGERGVREKRDSRGARCTHTVGGRSEQTDGWQYYFVLLITSGGINIRHEKKPRLFVFASGLYGDAVGSDSCFSGERGERSVLEKRDSRTARCTHTVGGREQTDLANIFKNKFQGKEKKLKGLQN